MQVAPEAATIAARGELDVSLTYDLTDRVPTEFGKLSREFQVTFSVDVSGIPQKAFVLTGTCRSHIAADPTVLHFGEANVRGQPPVSRRLDVHTDAETATIRVVPNDSSLTVGDVERHGNGWRVCLAPDVQRVRGRFATTLRLDALNPAGDVIGITRVAVDGVVREPAEIVWEGAHAP